MTDSKQYSYRNDYSNDNYGIKWLLSMLKQSRLGNISGNTHKKWQISP